MNLVADMKMRKLGPLTAALPGLGPFRKSIRTLMRTNEIEVWQ
jgi:hypothetical protein